MTESSTDRCALRAQFMAAQGLADAAMVPLDPDASTRRYFRLPEHQLLLMDAPPPVERPAEFIAATRYLEGFGARVPAIRASDVSQGFILIEDLGDATLTRLLDDGNPADPLYHLAVDELIRLHQSSRGNMATVDLPDYDEAAVLKEAALFVEWYLPARLGTALPASACDAFFRILSECFRALPAIDPVLVHRDFHVDNLLLVDERCAMIDYQDALIGSPVYDLISLLEDARRDVDDEMRKALIKRWCEHLNVPEDRCDQQAAFWAVQRHCKVAGIFVRLWLRDGKDGYLIHLDRVMRLLAHRLDTTPALSPLKDWMTRHLDTLSHGSFQGDRKALREICNVPS